MAKIVAIHSFRRGAGKSTLAANLTTLLALQGQRVGIVDTNFQAPILHALFNMPSDIQYLNDYLWGQCPIDQVVYPVELHSSPTTDEIYLVAAKPDFDNIVKILRHGYADNLLADGFNDLIDKLDLDFLIIDLYAGLHEETLFTMNLSDILFIVMRPNPQDYQGSSVAVEVIRHFEIPPEIILILNELPVDHDFIAAQDTLIQTYNCPIAFALPHAEELGVLAHNSGLFVEQYPHHFLTTVLTDIATNLLVTP